MQVSIASSNFMGGLLGGVAIGLTEAITSHSAGNSKISAVTDLGCAVIWTSVAYMALKEKKPALFGMAIGAGSVSAVASIFESTVSAIMI